MKKILLGAAAALVMGVSGAANAEIVMLPWTKVVDSTIHSENFGGCMIRVAMNVQDTAPQCRGAAASFLTFSCSGDLQDSESANKLFEAAQIAQLANRQIRFWVDTNRQHNSYCMVVRADMR